MTEMTFEEVKNYIALAEKKPFYLLNNVSKFVPDWRHEVRAMIDSLEKMISEEEIEEHTLPDTKTLLHGYFMLPAILLYEDNDTSALIFDALVIALDNYAQMFNNPNCLDAMTPLIKLAESKNTFSSLLTQAESVLLQLQAYSMNVNTPYKLSHKFLTTLLSDEEEEE